MTWATISVANLFVCLLSWSTAGAQSTSTVTGSKVQFNCKFKVGTDREAIQWIRILQDRILELSYNDKIFTYAPSELRERLNITGDHGSGVYNLMISDVNKTDEGEWVCRVYGQVNMKETHQLVVIVGPSSVDILNKQNNVLNGTEGLGLYIKCSANGGDPAPNMTLTIGTEIFTANSQHTIDHTIDSISRSYDGLTVTCQAGYSLITYTPKTDTANITLNLKPLTPKFNINPIVTENTKTLVLTCVSNGSRPAPTERIWLLGNSNIDITPSSTFPSPTLQQDGSYTVTSTLTYKINKIYNLQNITCGFKNIATGDEHVKVSSRMNVQYAPVVSVQNRTFSWTQTTRNISCNVASNPTATITRWQHQSQYGEIIRDFNGTSTLVLPQQTEGDRYQDTGEYICMVTNGIKDEDGDLDQTGSGYINSAAPPRFLDGASQVKLGQFGKDIIINASVYSVPKYSTSTWQKDGSNLTMSSKYTTSEVFDVLRVKFYSREVRVGGYRFSLSIQNLEENDFVNYTLILNNGVGQIVEHTVELISASPPETPANFSVTDETESTVVLHWMPSFDGGHDQWFVVQYRSEGSQTWKDTKIPALLQFNDVGLHSFMLPGLHDGTSYEIRMYAQNKFNKSAPTDTKNISTKEIASYGAIIGGVSGVLLLVVAALSIAALIMFKKRRGGNEAKKILRSQEESEDEGLKENILHNCDPVKKLPETSSSIYAEVQKPNVAYAVVQKPNTVNADVQKPNKQKINKPKKEKIAKGKKNNKGLNNNAPDTHHDMEQTEYANAEGSTGRHTNTDVLQYADITFSNQVRSVGGKQVIHGQDDRTIYSEVDHTKKAPPPPQEGAYELTDIGKEK